MMSEPWYENVDHDTPLTQGDLVFNCPLLTWKPGPVQLPPGQDAGHEVLKAATAAIRADVIVLSQACDLEHNKVANVILCPHLPLNEYKTRWEETMQSGKQNPTSKSWQRHCGDIRDGFNWNLAILNAGISGEISIPLRVVYFHEVFTAPRVFIESLLSQRMQPRLRLRPPYREHLSQAFARFFMRVGLPVPVEEDW
jgi:hypothetical protein